MLQRADLFVDIAQLRAEHCETIQPNSVMATLEQTWFGKLSFGANAASCLLSYEYSQITFILYL